MDYYEQKLKESEDLIECWLWLMIRLILGFIIAVAIYKFIA